LVFADDLEALARRYLAAYGPATVRDFATWSGLPVPLARRGVEAVATESFEVDGQSFVGVDDLPGCQELRFLGEFDAYLLGYQDRRYALAEEFRTRIHPGGGMLRPAIVAGGRVVGTWQHADRAYEWFGPEPAGLTAELADLERFG
jgi:hypothetical protein